MNGWNHFKTITFHKYLVMKGCFRVGLYKQGVLHDLSKYLPSEFGVGVKYYQGNRSPNDAEREIIGYSSAWLHHKGCNKHHYEYWIDYSLQNSAKIMAPVPMPIHFVIEMFMDRIAASKVYNMDRYTNKDPLHYYQKGLEKAHEMLHEETRAMLENLLKRLALEGEYKTFLYIRKNLLV